MPLVARFDRTDCALQRHDVEVGLALVFKRNFVSEKFVLRHFFAERL